MRLMKTNKQRRTNRDGTTLVETSLVLPIFFALIFAFIEFGHCYMTIHTMNAAARRSARLGIGDEGTTDGVVDAAREILGSAIGTDNENIQVWVKDGSIFEDPDVDPENVSYAELDDVLVENLEPRSLFIVRIQVPYSEVGILGPRWVTNFNMYGQSVMRKE